MEDLSLKCIKNRQFTKFASVWPEVDSQGVYNANGKNVFTSCALKKVNSVLVPSIATCSLKDFQLGFFSNMLLKSIFITYQLCLTRIITSVMLMYELAAQCLIM